MRKSHMWEATLQRGDGRIFTALFITEYSAKAYARLNYCTILSVTPYK